MCIVGSNKRFGEPQVTAQPDKWQEVRDLSLTLVHKDRAAQPGELGSGTDTGPPPGTSCPLLACWTAFPLLPTAFLSCLTPGRYLWRGAPQYRNGWARSQQQDVGRQTGGVPTAGGRTDGLK